QISRNSGKESQSKSSEASRVALAFPSSTKPEFTPLFGLVDKNAEKGSKSSYEYVSSGKAEAENALGNGLISLSNKQTQSKNVKSENEFKSFLSEGEKQGASFSFFSGNKKVGESSGPRTYYDFLKSREKYGDISVSESFPSREKELNNAVQKNTAFYSSLPQSYWDALSKSGYISENNAGKINDILNLNAKTQNRENLANTYGLASDVIGTKYQNNPITGKTPYKQEYNRDLITGKLSDINSENEISSFLKIPFVGKKVSTSTVPSTSFANVLQFAPGLGNKEIDLASRGLEKLVFEKAGPALTGAKETVVGKVRGVVANRVLYESPFLNTPKERPTLEKVPFRERATYRPTNPTRETLPSDILSKDTAQGPTPFSARQNTPRNTMFEDISKETQAKNTKIQNDLLTPRQPDNNPPASRNIPFFAGRKDVLGRLFTSNVEPVKTIKKPNPTSQASVTGLTSSASPINTITQPNSNLSPISRESYGVQFTG
ncbi:MAG: hypothetical protein KGI08_10350, partial [Thaumarchaeota archaeon]|nr:hypothetical protein [Nitrososphaerota archaeon]